MCMPADIYGSYTGISCRGQIDQKERKAAQRHDRLEAELNNYKTNLIKESIRMGHNDMGDFYYSKGDLQVCQSSQQVCSSHNDPVGGSLLLTCYQLHSWQASLTKQWVGVDHSLDARSHVLPVVWRIANSSFFGLDALFCVLRILVHSKPIHVWLQNAFKSYVRTRDYCTTGKHVIQMCLNVIRVSIELGNYVHVNNYISKAEQTPEVQVQSSSLLSCWNSPRQSPQVNVLMFM